MKLVLRLKVSIELFKFKIGPLVCSHIIDLLQILFILCNLCASLKRILNHCITRLISFLITLISLLFILSTLFLHPKHGSYHITIYLLNQLFICICSYSIAPSEVVIRSIFAQLFLM